VFAWVPSTGVTKVRFQLDTRPVRLDVEAPFDLVDGNQWWANGFSTTTMTKARTRCTWCQRSGDCLTAPPPSPSLIRLPTRGPQLLLRAFRRALFDGLSRRRAGRRPRRRSVARSR
jgi:hypothetical protein